MPSDPPPFVELALTPNEREQIETQLAASFGLTPEAARTWVETTTRRGVCFGRVAHGGVIAASYAAETVTLARGDERLAAVMLQSCYVHPEFRGRGYGLTRGDVAALRRRFRADAVILTLFDDGLVPYWRHRGFAVVQRAEVTSLATCLRRAASAFSPALTEEAIDAKLAEVSANGATATDLAVAGMRLVLVRYPGDDAVDELIVRPSPGGAAPASVGAAMADFRVRLKTVMASQGDLELVCAIDL